MLALLLKVLGFLQGPLLEAVKAHYKLVLIVLAIALQVFTINGWSHDHNALKAEQKAHQTDVQSYKDAQVAAEKKAAEIVKQLHEESKAKADEAEQNYSDLSAKYRANLLRYKANQGVPSGPGDRPSSYPPSLPNGAGTTPDISEDQVEEASYKVSGSDLDICTENTARLQAAHEWALSIKNQ